MRVLVVEDLVVEDDEAIAGLIQTGLTAFGYEVEVARSGTTGLQRALRNAYQVIILDWMMPGSDGPSVCRGLREAGDRTPVLMLTARDTVDDRSAVCWRERTTTSRSRSISGSSRRGWRPCCAATELSMTARSPLPTWR